MSARRHVLVAAVGLFALLGSGCAEVTSGSPGATLGLAGFVQQGARTTMSQRSADVTISGSFSAAGTDLTMTGTGQMDFVSKAITMSLHMKIGGQSADVTELFTGGTLYMKVSVGGQSSTDVTGGKEWGKLSIPGGLQAGGSGTSDPMQMLKYLSANGAVVKGLGRTTINGAAATGYTVTVPVSLMTKQATDALDKDPSVSASERAQILQALQGMAPMVLDVWFDPATHLLERMRSKIGLNVGGLTMDGVMTFDFTHYGVKVNVTPPPASDVAPITTH